mgnify:CR=1 FL=1
MATVAPSTEVQQIVTFWLDFSNRPGSQTPSNEITTEPVDEERTRVAMSVANGFSDV